MLHRCYNPKDPRYSSYGGRGISVCERWYKLINFVADMGERPVDTTLDRVDNSGGYNKDNCRWATGKEQQRNMRNNVLLTYNGVSKTLPQWAEELGINISTLSKRLGRGGWPVEEALNPKLRRGTHRFEKPKKKED